MTNYRKGVFGIIVIAIGILTACGNNPTLLTQKMLDNAGEIFVVTKDYTAGDAILRMTNQQTIVFNGGRIDNVILVGNHSNLFVKGSNPVFGKNVYIKGVWDIEEVHDGWFEFEEGRNFIANQLINNMLAFSNDSTFCHLFFEEDRTYYFELPYRGNARLGDMLSYSMVNGKKTYHFVELYDEEFAFLRIFTIPSNTTVTLNNTMQMLPTELGAYFVFWENGKENITIEGRGAIIGDNQEHCFDTPMVGQYYGEWGHIFRCFRCKNFVFRGITLKDAFGDCLIFQGSNILNEFRSRFADGLLVENVKIIGARRNGIALGARNVIIRNCYFEGCGNDEAKGTKPRSAIDFEPDGIKYYPEIGNQNVVMENCTFENNYYDVASFRNNLKNYGSNATTIKNCYFTAPLKIESTYWMRFENCYIPFIWNSKDDESQLLYSTNIEFIDCNFGQLDTVVPSPKNIYKNCKFNTAKDKTKPRKDISFKIK